MGALEFRETVHPLAERIKIAANNQGYLEPNCFGTAFFLLGVLPYDMVIFTNKDNDNITKALRKMKSVRAPSDNSIMISSNQNGIQHTAYIETSEPLKGYHRLGSESGFAEFCSLEEVDKYLDSISGSQMFRKTEWKNEFYILKKPRKLERWARDIVDQYHFGWDG